MAASPPFLANGEKKHWWISNKKIVEKFIRDAKIFIATQEPKEIASALSLVEAALAISPRFEIALELKARCLLYLRCYKDVAYMLQDYIPSLKMPNDDTSSTSSSGSFDSSKEQIRLISYGDEPNFKCFSISDLKKRVMASLYKNCNKEGQWRFLVLGQACCHLGLMEDAMVLLQTGKRLATDAFRRESICWSDDSFSFAKFPVFSGNSCCTTFPVTESETISQLLSHIKLLLRRKTAAIAALDAGLYSEAIRHFSKIVDGRRGAPQGFMAECYMHRASAYRSSGRIAEAIADCNRTLALDPSCINALRTRAALFETIRCLPDSLHDLEHLKLLYNSILRDRKLQGPIWKRHQNVAYREIPGRLCSLATKIQELKKRVGNGETGNVDYYALIGLKGGCSRPELERAHLLLTLRHKPDKSTSFVERCEFADEQDIDSVKDKAKMSALLLYRMIQRGYGSLMTTIKDEEAAEKQRKKAAAALQLMQQQVQLDQEQLQQSRTETFGTVSMQQHVQQIEEPKQSRAEILDSDMCNTNVTNATVFKGAFCRELTIVGNLLSQAGFNQPIPVKYEALSC
ncbi:uncharacterized protein LOC132605564 [Lycium barbarum]|uniref:uncharacterized protein LOC132605564 n=1 Tax=Lycium barbarum TaxID=112863 RepID=UPI00293E2CD5|nr:uncharacterized protein LOC132605564 [Lycium barbarum]